MNEKINFLIDTGINSEKIICCSLEHLNKTLHQLSENFLENIKNDILINNIITEEFIRYRNEIGIIVKGNVKNYTINQDLIEYLLRINYLHKSIKSVWGEGRDSTDIIIPFYIKTIKVKKYLLEDIDFLCKVSINIYNIKEDDEV